MVENTRGPELTAAPATEEAMRDYFFGLIGRTLGAPAPDWEAVLSQAYDWQGQAMVIPTGPPPGVQATAASPFFGLSQQWSGGRPKARIYLPTAAPDALGYYTRNIQYIEDAPGGGFRWSWKHIDGGAYVPVTGGGSSSPGGNQGGGGGTPGTPEVAALRTLLGALTEVVANLEARLQLVEGWKAEQDRTMRRVEGKVGRLVVKPAQTGARGIGPLSHSHAIPALEVVDRDTLPKEREG